jgi:GAF domain-containing protein
LSTESCAKDFAELHPLLIQLGIRAILIVPIINENRVIGSFSVDHSEPREFTSVEIDTCKLLASIVAGALSKASLLDPLIGATDLAQAGDDFPRKLVEVASRLVDASDAAFYVHYPRDKRLVLRAATSANWESTFDLSAQSGPPPVRMIHYGLPMLQSTPVDGAGTSPELDRREFWILLADGNRTAGVLAVRRETILERGDGLELQIFVRYAVASLFSAEEGLRDRALSDLLSRTEGESELGHALQTTADLVVNRFAVAVCRIVLWDRTGRLRADVRSRYGNVSRDIDPVEKQPSPSSSTYCLEFDTEWESCPSERRVRALFEGWLTPEELTSDIHVRFFPLRFAADLTGWMAVGGAGASHPRWLNLDDRTAREIRDRALSLTARHRWGELNMRRANLIVGLVDASRQLEGAIGETTLRGDIVRLGVTMTTATSGMLLGWSLDGLSPIDKLHEGHGSEALKCIIEQAAFKDRLRLPAALLLTLKEGRSVWLTEGDDSGDFRECFEQQRNKAVSLSPLFPAAGDSDSVLLLAFAKDPVPPSEITLPILDLFAARASLALAQSHEKAQDEERPYLDLFRSAANYCSAESDRRRAERAVLTAVTASYGLKYNRAVLFRFEQRGSELQLRFEDAVGASTKKIAERQWSQFHGGPHASFAAFLKTLGAGLRNEEELHFRLAEMPVLVEDQLGPGLKRLIRSGETVKTEAVELPSIFQSHFLAESEVILQPVIADNQLLGVIVADNKYSHAPLDGGITWLGSLAELLAHVLIRDRQRGSSDTTEAGASEAPEQSLGSSEDLLQDTLRRIGEPLSTVESEARRLFGADGSITLEWARVPSEVEPLVAASLGGSAYLDSNSFSPELSPVRFQSYGSWQAVRLQDEAGTAAVLLLFFRKPRVFDQAGIERLLMFASAAAKSVRSGLLLKNIAEDRWATGSHLTRHLNMLAEEARAASRCDAATLFSYSPSRYRFHHPPGLANVMDREAVLGNEVVIPNSFLHRLIYLQEPQFIEDVPRSSYAKSPFVERERVTSLAIWPLDSEAETIGLLFLNYRKPHSFDDLERIRLQGVARRIGDTLALAQKVEQSKRMFNRLSAIVALSQKLLTYDDARSAYRAIVETAASQLEAGWANIVTPEPDGRLRLEAEIGWSPEFQVGQHYRSDEAHHARAVITRRSVIPVEDFELPQSFEIAETICKRRILSGLGAPMKLSDGRILGALLIHSVERRCFDEDEVQFLCVLAAQAAAVSAQDELRDQPERQDRVSRALRSVQRSLTDAAYLLRVAQDRSSDRPSQHCLAIASSALTDAERILDDIAIQSEGVVQPVESSAHVGTALERVWQVYSGLSAYRHIRIEPPSGDALARRAAIDTPNLHLLVSNMIARATSLARIESAIRVSATRQSDRIVVEVRFEADGAPGPTGIEDATCERIAERFCGKFVERPGALEVELQEWSPHEDYV